LFLGIGHGKSLIAASLIEYLDEPALFVTVKSALAGVTKVLVEMNIETDV